LEKKQNFRKELYEQVVQKEAILEQQKALKAIECTNIKKLNEKLNEEEQFGKYELINNYYYIRFILIEHFSLNIFS